METLIGIWIQVVSDQVVTATDPTDSPSEARESLLRNLNVGTRMEITPIGGAAGARFYATYVGHLPELSLLATMPQAAGSPMLAIKGAWVSVRLILEGGLYTFQTTILHVATEPCRYLHLELPKRVSQSNLRRWPRVSVLLPVGVSARAPFPDGMREARATLLNISVGGALVESAIRLGEPGSRLVLSGHFVVGPFERDLSIPCVIRNIRNPAATDLGRPLVLHGVEFTLENEEDTTLLYCYVYEQIIFAETRRLV